ncbi:MAG TPA: DUF4199 domain-containing protein, partial [Lacunisphaera sp.]|nr:DUF4199 domain-containing protein [Lacunisphaera sp.]
ALKYGLLAAVAMVLWLLGEYAFGFHGPRLAVGQYTSWGPEIILVLAIWRLLHHQLHAANRYWLPVWQGLLQGLLASLVAALGLYIFLSVYLQFINPEFPDIYLEWEVGRLRASARPEEEIREIARGFRWSTSPVGLPVSIVGLCLVIGLVTSPLLTLWLNWRRKETVDPG